MMSEAEKYVQAAGLRNKEIIPARGAAALTPMAMLSQAVKSGAGVEVLKELMALNERWDAFQARKAFDAAMADAKALIGPIVKNRTVDFKSKGGGADTNYRHEDLAEIARTVDPILAQFGLSYRFKTSQEDGRIRVTCIVSHRDGHFETNSLMANADTTGNKNSIQAIGSAITYLQRYTLKAALGLAASNDDDGKGAGTIDAGETISEAQYETLAQRLSAPQHNAEKFFAALKIDSLGDLPASRFNEAMTRIDERERMIAQKAQKEPPHA